MTFLGDLSVLAVDQFEARGMLKLGNKVRIYGSYTARVVAFVIPVQMLIHGLGHSLASRNFPRNLPFFSANA